MLKSLKKIGLKSFNLYSWALIAIFILVSCIIESFHRTSPFEGSFISFPLITLAVFFCQMNENLKRSISKKHNWIDIFIKNIFLITYCFLVGSIFFVILNHRNADVGGWCPILLYVMYFYGFIFSLIFSTISWGASYYNPIYNSFFCIIIILLLATLNIFPHYIKIAHLGEIDVLFVILFGLLTTHLFFTILFKLLSISYVK